MKQALNVLVIGASSGSGLEAVKELVMQGHQVTAFSRNASKVTLTSETLQKIDGDAMNQDDVERAVQGKDAVIITLGINENPLRVRFFGSAGTPLRIRSLGTKNVIQAMQKHEVSRLIVQTSYGVGETRELLGWKERIFFSLILAPQIQDTEVQEEVVRNSGLDWVLAQPVHLNDQSEDKEPFLSIDGTVREMQVSRKQVAKALAKALTEKRFLGHSLSISG